MSKPFIPANQKSISLCFIITLLSIFNAIAAPPVITSFSPASGPVGTSVTITGSGFNTTAAGNIVFFGATMATVTAAGANSLTVTVPAGATYQPISVLNGATQLVAYSAKPFITTFNSKFAITAADIAPKVDFPTGANPYSIAIADIDGDGKADIVIANLNAASVSVLRNTSAKGSITASSFAPKVDFATGVPSGIAVGDIDNDGKPDIITVSNSAGTVSVLRNTATSGSIDAASFATKVDFVTGAGPISVAIGDIDDDGKPDLVVANFTDNTVSLLRNTSVSGGITTSSFAPKVDIAADVNPISVAIADLDGDGKPDIVTANYGVNTISVLQNISVAGSFAFSTQVEYPTNDVDSFGLAYVVIGDLDGDGKPDVVVSNAVDNTLSVFRNNISSAGIFTGTSFNSPWAYTTAGGANNIAIADIDGDGKPELVVPNLLNSSVSIFRNTATSGSINASSFAANVDFATGNLNAAIAVADFDGDGRPDIASANSGDNTVSVLYNMDVPVPIAPTVQATNLIFTTTTTTSTTASWTNGNGSLRAVFMLATPGGSPAPIDATTYTANTTFASGTQIGTTGWYCVYNGTGNTVNITGLTANTNYQVMVIEYNGTPGSEKYLTIDVTGNPANIATPSIVIPAAILTTGSLSALSTTYGTPSATGTFNVSGTNMTAGILVTPPAGFEVSASATTGFGSTVTIGAAGTIASTPVYIRLTGVSVGNYSGNITLTSSGATTINVATVTSTVNKATLTVSAAGTNKVYDNTTAAIVTLTDNRISGDVFTTNYTTAVFANKNVGAAKTITVSGIAISGGASANYIVNTTATATANITAAAATVTAQADTKVYSATIASAKIPIVTGLIGIDAVSTAPIQTFDTPNTGTNKTLTASGLVINDGNNGNNYSVNYVPNTTGIITTATLTYIATPVSRAIGAANPLFTGTVTGFAGSDTQVTATAGVLSFTTTATTNSPVGSYTITGSGLTAANYVFVQAPANNTALTILAASANANLANLVVSAGVLSPVFAAATKSYAETVDNSISTVTITPTVADPTATVTINSIAVTSGSASAAIVLNLGDNIITTIVTAQDGITKQTYTIIIHRDDLQGAVIANNMITPNGDGKNDTWVIKNIQSYPNNNVTVFDRHGTIVYTKQGYTNDWGATFRGTILNEDTYYYVIDLGSGLSKIKGFITVIRDK